MAEFARVALAAYNLVHHRNFSDWRTNIENWVAEAVSQKATMLVFPEYCSTDMAGLIACGPSANELLAGLQGQLSAYLETFIQLSKRHSVYIVAGSFVVRENDKYFNRSFFS